MGIMSNTQLRDALGLLLENERRNQHVEAPRYWYPLSLATYGLDEIMEALDSMCSFRTSMGEKTYRFEQMFAHYQSCADAVMVNSGSSADLLLGLLLSNPLSPLVRPGDEVIVPVVTWPTQIWAMMMAGLKVRLVDVDIHTLNVDLDDLEATISERTRVLFLVHLMGNPCNMERIQEIVRGHQILLIEDCCEAMGASWDGRKVGNFGLGAAFSFFFSHHITTMEGGMVVTSDECAAEQLRIQRAHGWVRNVNAARFDLHLFTDIDPRYAFVNWGVNVRPTEVQAAFGIHQLALAPAFASRREQLSGRFATYLSKRTADLSMPHVAPKAVPSWLALPLIVHKGAPFNRKEITFYLETAGVETRPIVAGNLARHPVAARFSELQVRAFIGADEIHQCGFYIGLSPLQSDAAMDRLIEVFDRFLARY